MAAGNKPRNNQIRVFDRYILKSIPAPIKRLIFADVGNIDGRTEFVLALDIINELTVINGSINKLFNIRMIVFAGRIIIGK
jgi:hypothetical protein